MYISLILIASASFTYSAPADISRRLKNGVGVTPAMGFNNWNSGLCRFSQPLSSTQHTHKTSLASSAATALAAASAFVSLGLRDAGYEYINTDDTWSASARAANGTLVADSTKWPNGIAVVAAEIHSMGLKMGE